MNAYELSDELDTVLKTIGLENNRVPTMLQQQADRILELEAELLAVKMQLKEIGIIP